MHRFFIDKKNFEDMSIIFPADISHQIAHVLRLKAGDKVVVLDNSGFEYLTALNLIDSQKTKAQIITKDQIQSEPDNELHLFISLTQREKFELILQKCTEIGVHAFHPYISSRSLPGLDQISTNKIERWKKILREASEQSGRGVIPELIEIQDFKMAITESDDFDLKLFAWEEAKLAQDMKDKLNDMSLKKRIALFIGPEGGFTQEEAELANAWGWEIISLGKLTLRMETASIVASALILFS